MRIGWIFLAAAFLAGSNAGAATPMASAGGTHSLALHADGTLRAWGDDSAGALGAGRSLASPAPNVVPGLTGVIAVSAGDYHTLALRADGTVWAWGANSVGQLGDATTTSRSTPAPIAGLAGIVEVAAGGVHNLARAADGSVWTWGANYVGALGTERSGGGVPERVPGFTDAIAVAAGREHSLVLRADGTVWAFGRNDEGQLGDGTQTELYTGRFQPRQAAGLTGATRISGGESISMALRSDGTVWVWGNTQYGNSGDGTTTLRRLVPTQVPNFGGAVEIAAGWASYAVKGDGTVWGWGSNGYGQLGDDTYIDRLVPVQLPGLTNVVRMATNSLHAGAVRNDGSLWTWGYNGYGQVGDGSVQLRNAPVPSLLTSGVSKVAFGADHSVALGTDGRVRTWGNNSSGQLGDGVRVFSATPLVPAISGIVQVAAGGRHSVALKSDGTVLAAGNNDMAAQLGDGTSDNRATFGPVKLLSNVVEISAAVFHSVARKSDGTVWAWGSNYEGRLGIGDVEGPRVPVQVDSLANVTQVSAAGGHSLALRADGTVWAWGENFAGQLGDNTTSSRFRPVQVVGLPPVVEVAAGETHSLARGADGAVYAWGSNYSGQLGNGTNADRPFPGRVTGLPPARSIAAGGSVSAAIASDASVWMWGANYAGQLGDGSGQEQATAVRLEGLANVARISVGGGHAIATLDDGSLVAWGINEYGQLGDGTLANRLSPVVVVREGGAGSVAANDWFLDLDPARATTIPPERVPIFLAIARGAGSTISADIKYRAQDIGSTASTFVFALVPANQLAGAATPKGSQIGIKARLGGKATDVQCALAQLNAQGQLIAVSAASLQAYVSGVISAQGASVNILNNTPPPAAAGATFYVGYGANGNAMLVNGTTRSVVTVPGSVACRPQAPQTGWWYNPAEPGRGFSIEARGNRLFFAAFHYDIPGRATWNFSAGATSLDGSLFTSDFLAASNGQTLTGPYHLPNVAPAGNLTLIFSDDSHGTMTWPGGTIPIERQPFVPNGLTAPPQANQPEGGWWWNPQESGRGFFIEWQNGFADLAGYMYDDAGNPTWYISAFPTPNPRVFEGSWWSFANGQSMGGAFRPATRVNDNVGSVRIDFTTSTTATMTLPNGTRIPLERQRF